DGRVFDLMTTPLHGGNDAVLGQIGFVRDVTLDRRRADAEGFLLAASKELASSLDYRRTLAKVARLAVPHLADWCAVDFLEPDGSIRQLAIAHVDPNQIQLAEKIQLRNPSPEDSSGVARVIRTGRPELYP